MRFGKSSLLVAASLGLCAFTSQSFGIEASTDPLGVIQINALGNSDTLVSLPLKHPSDFNGVVASVDGSVVTLAGTPGWTADDWVYNGDTQLSTYYLFVRDGDMAGSYFTIVDNDAASVTLDVAGSDLSGLLADTAVSIHPYYTLAELFPEGEGLNESTSAVDRQSELFFPDIAGEGINLASAATFFFMDGHFHRVGGDLSEIYDNYILLPDGYFILRNNVATATEISFLGEVIMSDVAMPLIALEGTQQDNIIGLQRPIEMTLDESGLITSNAFAVTTDPSDIQDMLLVFDMSEAKKNRSANDADRYFYYNNGWRLDGADIATDYGDTEVFTPGTGFIIRKAAALADEQKVWSNSANY